MKVLILRGTTREVDNDPGWYFHLTLDGLGVENEWMCHDTMTRGGGVLKAIERATSQLGGRAQSRWIDRYKHLQADRAVLDQVRRFKPDLILVMNGKTVRPCLLQEVKSAHPGVLIVNVFWDNPFFYDVPFGSMPEYDVFYVKDTYVLNEARKLGATNVRYLHHACYPPEHRPLFDITPEERAQYGSDLSFVGSMYPYRSRILDVFADMDLKIWGGPPRGRIPDGSVAFTRHQGRRVWGRQKVLVFNCSKVNLNTQNFQNDVFSVSSKVHQLAASGGFQLVDWKPDLERLYDLDREVIAFRSREELRELAEHYVDHASERNAIAQRARQRALAEHTYAHRWRSIVEETGL